MRSVKACDIQVAGPVTGFQLERGGVSSQPYYGLVPKDLSENIDYRKKLIKVSVAERSVREALWAACAQDVLFYVNAFGWTYDPRRSGSAAIPFVTWDYQDEALLAIVESIMTGQDLAIEKSRDMGASWLCLVAFEWMWHFRPLQSFLLISRKEDLVDKTGDLDSLMQKLDLFHKLQPQWLVPGVERNRLHMRNLANGSTIDGESTAADTARGGRRTAILMDEFASVENGYAMLNATRDATNCRIFNSTPKGASNAFYDVVNGGCKNRRLRFHWPLHPIKSRGLYYLGVQPRSPWYDKQCARAAHPQEIAQELDIDYLGSDYAFFPPEVLDRIRREDVRPAYHQGDLDWEESTCKPTGFTEREGGPFRLWMHPASDGLPAKDRGYALGIDVATGAYDGRGEGASNSSISVVDRRTGEKVAEYTISGIDPQEFARRAVALARWFRGTDEDGAYMIWEANGPGQLFGNEILKQGYRNVYWRRDERKLSKKASDVPGWWTTRDSKRTLLGEYSKALTEGKFINRSLESLGEARLYVYCSNGSVAHSRAQHSADPTGARENHGDRVIADALAAKALMDRPVLPEAEEQEPPFMSVGWRHKKYEDLKKLMSDW